MRLAVSLDLTGRRAVVVGAGPVGVRRVRRLLDAGADVLVVAPHASPELDPRAQVVLREFEPGDLDEAWLVVAATDDADVNAAVAAAASDRGVWCSRADAADESPLWFAATGAVDDVQVAVTAGGDPGRARTLRDDAVRALQTGSWRARRTRPRTGRVVLIGGGPGDPDLLTLGGHRALLDADVVVTDRLGPTDLLAHLPADVEVVDVGKDPRGDAVDQDTINALLIERARRGEVVARLKGGDPFVLGRGSEEVAACTAAGVAIDVIPGVSSVTAAPTLAGIPLTRRGTAQAFSVLSGHVPPGDPRSTIDWAAAGASGHTLLLLMAVANLGPIADALISGGRSAETPCAVVERASAADQRVTRATLRDVAAAAERAGVVPPAVVVVGDVVSALPAADARS